MAFIRQRETPYNIVANGNGLSSYIVGPFR